jgi:hypothetical protein
MNRFTQIITIYLAGVILSPALIAASAPEVTCPTVSQLQTYVLDATDLSGFDQKTQQALFDALMYEKSLDRKHWYFSIIAMKASKDDDVRALIADTINQLQPVSNDPFQYMEWRWKSEKVPVCIYTIPGNNTLYAEAALYDPLYVPDNEVKYLRSMRRFT